MTIHPVMTSSPTFITVDTSAADSNCPMFHGQGQPTVHDNGKYAPLPIGDGSGSAGGSGGGSGGGSVGAGPSGSPKPQPGGGGGSTRGSLQTTGIGQVPGISKLMPEEDGGIRQPNHPLGMPPPQAQNSHDGPELDLETCMARTTCSESLRIKRVPFLIAWIPSVVLVSCMLAGTTSSAQIQTDLIVTPCNGSGEIGPDLVGETTSFITNERPPTPGTIAPLAQHTHISVRGAAPGVASAQHVPVTDNTVLFFLGSLGFFLTSVVWHLYIRYGWVRDGAKGLDARASGAMAMGRMGVMNLSGPVGTAVPMSEAIGAPRQKAVKGASKRGAATKHLAAAAMEAGAETEAKPMQVVKAAAETPDPAQHGTLVVAAAT